MKPRQKSDGTYYGRVTIGHTPEGKPIYQQIVADSALELWRMHYLLKNSLKIEPRKFSKEAREDQVSII